MQGYWARFTRERISRRRALIGGGSAALSAAFLAACGGGGDGGDAGDGGGSGLLTQPQDSTKDAKRGGTLIMTNPADPPHFDPHLLTLPAAAATSLIFNKLMKVKPGILEPSDGTIEGDLAESWEFSPDRTTLTIKLRPDAGSPNQPPLNGRKMDAEDVVYSWNRWRATGTNRADLVNEVNPAAPVLSLTAADSRTVVVKLKEPIASILANFSSQLQGQFFIVPREAEAGFDIRRNPIGFGTYYLERYQPSSTLVYARNPNTFEKNTAWPDRIETPIISESAQVIAQLIAGGIYTHYTAVSPDSVVGIKRDAPDIGLYPTDIANVGVTTFFGFKASPPERTPFRDVRVRQAWSMSIDRDLYLDAFANVSKFEADGLPVETAWNSALAPADYRGWWLDPKSKDFGPNGQYYSHNVAEAKKLLSAAGYPDGVNVISNQIGSTDYGLLYARQIEVIEGMNAEAGFRFQKAIHGYTTNWNSEFRDSRGYFEGVAYRLTPIPAEPGDALYVTYNKNGSFYYGFDPDGKGVTSPQGPFLGDPTCDDLTQKIRTEFDTSKRIGYAHELQRYLGKMQYFSRALGSATGFNVAWPVVRNFAIYRGLSWGYLWQNYWIDETKPPLRRA